MSILRLQEAPLDRHDYKFVLTAHFTQDCFENLFSCVRSKNRVPTPLQFKNKLRVLTVGQYLKGTDSGCYQLDDGYVLWT